MKETFQVSFIFIILKQYQTKHTLGKHRRRHQSYPVTSSILWHCVLSIKRYSAHHIDIGASINDCISGWSRNCLFLFIGKGY